MVGGMFLYDADKILLTVDRTGTFLARRLGYKPNCLPFYASLVMMENMLPK